MSISKELTEILNQQGCHIVGYADLRSLASESRENFNYAVVMGTTFSKEAMVENINNQPQRYYDEYGTMDKKRNELRETVISFLNGKGYKALGDAPIFDGYNEILRAPLSFQTVATLAGLGWRGNCSILMTPQSGGALRLTIVLTNAPLECGQPITKSKCPPNCTICADVCPGKAPSGKLWDSTINRDDLFNAFDCQKAARERARKLVGKNMSLCGLCISHCPITKKALGYK